VTLKKLPEKAEAPEETYFADLAPEEPEMQILAPMEAAAPYHAAPEEEEQDWLAPEESAAPQEFDEAPEESDAPMEDAQLRAAIESFQTRR